MHKLAVLDHQIKLAEKIYLQAVSSASFYGKSIFTTIAVYNSEIFQWQKHRRRINENANRLGIDLSGFSEEEIKKSVYDLISANGFQNGRVRLTFFDESGTGLWSLGEEKKTSLLITSADFKANSGELRLTISPFPINSKSSFVNLKSGNYLENILALEEAHGRRFDEAVRLNEKGQVVSATMANIFWISNKNIYTSSLETGVLYGTTREFIKENFKVFEKIITLEELNSADEIFLTSAGFGVAKVKSFEEKTFTDFSVFDEIQNFFDNLVAKLTQSREIP